MGARARTVACCHALEESVPAAVACFQELWPEANLVHFQDFALSRDRQSGKVSEDAICERIMALGRAAEESGADATLFTCSAFGDAIDAVKRAYPRSLVLAPNECAFRESIASGRRSHIFVTFEPSLPLLLAEYRSLAGAGAEARGHLVEGALGALRAGRAGEHGVRIAEAIRSAAMAAGGEPGSAILGQFSMARARDLSARGLPEGWTVSTTLEASVRWLRDQLH
mmetsp:Transcript_15085/g.38280  ORF Transcript_15085/g.38280 Transcript_15085/m.38280 type:complete len:226 (-) Transcript_15085:530-1207(-)